MNDRREVDLGRDRVREREIGELIAGALLATGTQRHAYAYDPQTAAHVEILRKLLTAAERAMTAEGVGEDVRDRVINRVLFGEPAEVSAAPDFAAARERIAEREAFARAVAEGELPVKMGLHGVW